MTKKLDVYFADEIMGELIQDQYGDIGFTYVQSWLDNPKSIPISCSLPLQKETFKRKQCFGFFEGILPEQHQRKIIARILGISDRNDFSMLEKIGGECAGALSFIPSGEKLALEQEKYQTLKNQELFRILKELPAKPLLAGERGIRLSLAGVQDKLAVYLHDGKICLPLNNAPSSHILKPMYGQYEDIVFNEAFCLKLAKIVGLSVVETKINHIENIYYLLIKRYDRIEEHGKIKRLHQEDFCQALGIPSTKKYQNEEGPTLKQCFELIKNKTTTPVVELNKLLQAIIFNFLIGNCDAHGKNFSLLYAEKTELAPLYDLICTLYYNELDKKMAMKLGGEYHAEKILLKNIDKFSQEIGFSKIAVRKAFLFLAEKIMHSLGKIEIEHISQQKIAEIILNRCSILLITINTMSVI
jgi:serine/threonine-protein kinase HipA